MEISIKETELKFSKIFIYATILVCILPYILQLLGVNFGNEDFKGKYVHLLLEWSAVCIAFCTAILAFIQYRLTNNPATPIIGMALLCAGSIDAFHALAAIKILTSVAENDNFTPFSWALSRMFNGFILIIGICIFLFKVNDRIAPKRERIFIFTISGLFLLLAYASVKFCALSSKLPNTTFPNSFITRPYDIIPLILFIFMGLWLLPKFHRKEKNIFSSALMWSMIPAIATQLHMAFGSKILYDSDFNIGHFLKAISYFIPFIGITLDYISTYRKEKNRITELNNAQLILKKKNKELEQFAYITSHDLQEPLRTVMNFTSLFKNEYEEQLDENATIYLTFIAQASNRMSLLIKGLLDYSRIGSKRETVSVDCTQLLKELEIDLHTSIKESGTTFVTDNLPTIKAYKTELRMLFQNLISNAIKFRKKDVPPLITITGKNKNDFWEFSIEDNGIGIADKNKEKVFSIFQRLHSKDEYEGTGIGLAHCQKIVDLHEGDIWVTSELNKGSVFNFTIKK